MFSVCVFAEDEVLRDSLVNYFSLRGCGVSAVRNGTEEFIKKIFSKNFDLILADIGFGERAKFKILEKSKVLFPNRRHFLIASDLKMFSLLKDSAYIDGYCFRPCRLSDITSKACRLIEKDAASKIRRFFYKRFKDEIIEIRSWLRRAAGALLGFFGIINIKSVDKFRNLALKQTYAYFQSSRCCRSTALNVWKRLEYLERCYLLYLCGCSVDLKILNFYYQTLYSQTECGLKGGCVYPGNGFKYGPKLEKDDFSHFYFAVRSGIIDFEQFKSAAEIRIISNINYLDEQNFDGESGAYISRRTLEQLKKEQNALMRIKCAGLKLYKKLWDGSSDFKRKLQCRIKHAADKRTAVKVCMQSF